MASSAGPDAFELYDTFGFPIDLTQLLAAEMGFKVDLEGFQAGLTAQRERGRADAAKVVGDWTVLSDEDSQFIGYDYLSDAGAKITKYRTVRGEGQTPIPARARPHPLLR